MDQPQLLELCGGLVEAAQRAGADQAEAAASWSRDIETHMENGDVHSVSTSDETMFGLRVLVGDRMGFVTANETDPSALAVFAAEAVAQARLNPADENNGLPDPLPVPAVEGLHDPAVESLDAAYTTGVAAELLERVKEGDERVRIDSGSVSASMSTTALASSRGVAVSESDTALQSYLFGMAVDGDEVASFDYDGAVVRSLADFRTKADQAVDRFVAKCIGGLGAGSADSYRGTVLLSPEAVAELVLSTLMGALCADQVRKGRSRLADRVGDSIASTCLTLTDDGRLPAGAGSSAFDRDGLPTARRAIVDGGRLTGYLFNHYEARAAGQTGLSTGNASGSVASLPGIGPHHLEIQPGPTDDLLGNDETALLVGRFSGSTNGVTGDFSGVAKNGFVISGAERRPVKEVLIAGNVFDLLGNIAAVGRTRRDIGGQALLPCLRVEDVSVTAG